MSSSTLSRRLYWAMALMGAAAFVIPRMTIAYASDSPLGVAFGIAAYGLIVLSLAAGLVSGGTTRVARLARETHRPLGTLAVAAALAQWHPRWRDYLGIATAVLVLLVALSLALNRFRRVRGLRLIHKYGAYALVAIALTHGVRALFFAGN